MEISAIWIVNLIRKSNIYGYQAGKGWQNWSREHLIQFFRFKKRIKAIIFDGAWGKSWGQRLN